METINKTKELIEKDKKYLWHPFTQMRDWQKEDVLLIEKGEGSYLIDTDGKRYLDGVSSLWCNVHGHQVPELDEAISKQMKKIVHTTFLGLSHPPAVELAEKLIEITPENLTRVFYSDSGSEAAEIALKIAFHYWKHQGKPEKSKFIKLQHAYHGDTIGAVSVGGMELFHQIYDSLLFETYEIPSPYAYRWPEEKTFEQVGEASLKVLEKILEENHDNIAAFIMEPLVQGAAGMIMQPSGYISRVRELTKKYNVLLIFDEVATGFGRTGKMFALEHENVKPDILTLAKGITGGYLPLAATITSEEIYQAFLGEYEELKTFFHGHTYTANPLACEVAIASLKLFEDKKVLQQLQEKISFLESELKKFSDLKCVGDIRQLGMMIGIELVTDKGTKQTFPMKENRPHKIVKRAREKGAIIRPLGPVMVLMPPLGMNQKELKSLLDITYQSIKEETES